MADVTKAQKLAAARKKLKEYQQKSHKPIKQAPETEEHVESGESSCSNKHYNKNTVPSEHENQASFTSVSPFHNYFTGNQQSLFSQNSGNFFDSLQSDSQTYNEHQQNCGTGVTVSDFVKDSIEILTPHTSEVNTNAFVIENDDVKSLDYPELQKNDLYTYFHNTKFAEHPSVSSEDAQKLSEYMSTQVENDNANSVHQNKNIVDLHDSPNQEDFNVVIENTKNLNLSSNTESLHQLSSQIIEYIKDDSDSISNFHNIELEKRNEELAALLTQERDELQRLQLQLQEYKNKIEYFESESEQSKIEYEHRLNRELGPLQEQLQCHMQTVGILVGQKTELSAELSQSQLVTKQKIAECEELQGRLKTSRSRVADLEKELQFLRAEKLKLEQSHVQDEQMAILKNELQDISNQKENAIQDLSELQEKLNVKSNENLTLQRDLQEISHQLSLAQIKIEQLTAGSNLQTEVQVELLTQQKLELEKQILELSQTLKTTREERDQASGLYHNYVQQLNTQVTSLASKLETVTSENEVLINREQDLVRHVGELEKRLQTIQEEHLNRTNSGENNKALDYNIELIESLKIEKSKLQENYQQILNERDDLLREIENNKDVVEKLEMDLEKVEGIQPDNVKLLAAMESDKVAAARAVSQNLELKQQLEEMQQAFVRMSNDKLDLTDKLNSEEYKNHELGERLSQLESQLHTLSDAITIKDNELTQMRETLVHKNKQILQQDQLADRLRHYEAQDTSSYALQHELRNAQDQLEIVTKENAKLKKELEDSKLQNISAPVTSKIKENVEEALAVLSQHEENVENKVAVTHTDSECQTISNNEAHNLDVNILDKEIAMQHLEQKFTRTMQDIANLTEEKQRLEHIVTQLQGETETIGEYIALYQHQRGILKQRTQEKDEQLKRLAHDREKVRAKLDALNELVKKLVLEKGSLPSEFLEQHHKLNNETHQLCSEHAKVQEAMVKITQENLNNSDSKEAHHVYENNNVSTETAKEIIALLSEIKSSNLIQPYDGLENFHPCPWCSGQLLTV